MGNSAMPDEESVSFSPSRRWRIGLNVLISSLALVAIVVLLNYLAARYSKRFELGHQSRDALTPVTLRVLQGITNKVQAVVFFSHRQALYEPVMRLLRQYELRSQKIELEQVDYERYPGRAKQVLGQFNQDVSDEGDRVIFAANGRTKVVHESELSVYDNPAQAILSGSEIKRTGFRGEELFTAAIFSVTDPKPMRACFVRGHNEADPGDDKSGAAYAEFAHVLQESNVRAGIVSLLDGEVPEGCNLLIIAGAQTALAPAELDRINRYLLQGGRLLVLYFGAAMEQRSSDRTKLDRLLANWGVEVGLNQVIDKENAPAGSLDEVIVTEFGSHPIVNPLRRSRVALVIPRSIRARPTAGSGADAPHITELLLTSPKAVAMKADGTFKTQSSGKPISLAVAVEKGNIQGITADRGATRIVVVGDSFFLGNVPIQAAANRDFARNVLNWLLSRERLIEGIGPRPLNDEYRISLTQHELNSARWILLAGLPGSVLLFGWLVWLRRRS